MGNFLVSFLSHVYGPTLDFVNLSLTLTGNKKRERRLWSLPSSNIMESGSLGFGRKRCWWRHDGVMPSCLRWLFRWSPPPLKHRLELKGAHNTTCQQAALGNTNRSLEENKQTSAFECFHAQGHFCHPHGLRDPRET